MNKNFRIEVEKLRRSLNPYEVSEKSNAIVEQLFYLMSRGLTKKEATQMIIMGFIEPFSKELPMEYAVELNQLIKMDMEGSVG